jgi:hypothetical protein
MTAGERDVMTAEERAYFEASDSKLEEWAKQRARGKAKAKALVPAATIDQLSRALGAVSMAMARHGVRLGPVNLHIGPEGRSHRAVASGSRLCGRSCGGSKWAWDVREPEQRVR